MPETYPAWGRKRSLHGDIYQLKWVMLLLKRAVDVGYSFRLATEMESAAGFDDIVFKDEQNKKIRKFIQIKHKQNECEKIGVGKLLSKDKSGEFSLAKYFVPYLKIKNNQDFADGDLKDFTICTNIGFDLAQSTTQNTIKKLKAKTSGPNKGIEIAVEVISTSDIFFKYGGTRYKFSCTHDNMISIVQPAFKSAVKEAIEELEKEIKELQGKSDQNSKRKLERNQVWQREFERMTNEGKLEENIREFFDKLVFAVDQPNEIKLAEIIENELGKEFNNIDKKNVYGRFLVEVLDWMKAREGKFLSHEEINEFFEKIREEILGAVWFGIIEPVASFTGRGRVLTALHNVLQRSAKKQAVISQVASISGLGGVGKSELARKYAYKYGKDYYGNVIWISAENSKTMESSFLDLAKDDKLGISPQDKYGNDKMIETIVKETYAFFARRGRKSLFIFDNAEGYKDISKFLPLSLDNKPYILITSRNKDWGISEDEGEIKTIQLGVFKETEALKFVKRALNIRNNLQDEEIKNLTEELQYFPLALKQAVAYINEKNVVLSYRGKEKIGVSDYLKKYEEEAEKLLDFESKYGGDRYTKTTFITWKITIDAIAQKECGFEALSILEIMAYLAPDKIHIEEIFSKLIADDEEKLWNAVKLLDRYSMIDLKEGVANIHRLVQKVTELNLQKEGREEEVLRKALELINSGNIVKDSTIHVASVWGYASKHSGLIDDFYFDSVYTYQEISYTEISTPLHLLAENGNYKAIKALLTHIEKEHSSSFNNVINARKNYGRTALHVAAKNGKLYVVKYLISKGIDINSRDEAEWTPLMSAVYGGELNTVRYLIDVGADINAKSRLCSTSLHFAADSGELDIVKCLVFKGANVNAKNIDCRTPLHFAADNGNLSVIKYLIRKGADINAEDEYANIPLYFAIRNRKLEIVKYLVDKTDINNKYNDTLLHLAVCSGELDVAKYLVSRGVDINAKSKFLPLHLSSLRGLNIVGYFVKKVASAEGGYYETPLHYAVFHGNLEITEYLIEKGADVNARNRNSDTPLHLAAMNGNVDIAKILLKHNADVNAKNNEGKTALDYATNNNHQELVELLLAHGAFREY